MYKQTTKVHHAHYVRMYYIYIGHKSNLGTCNLKVASKIARRLFWIEWNCTANWTFVTTIIIKICKDRDMNDDDEWVVCAESCLSLYVYVCRCSVSLLLFRTHKTTKPNKNLCNWVSQHWLPQVHSLRMLLTNLINDVHTQPHERNCSLGRVFQIAIHAEKSRYSLN